MSRSIRTAAFASPPTSFEFHRVAANNEDSDQPHVVFKNNGGELTVPVDRFMTGDYVAWKDKNVLNTHQVQRAVAEVVKLGL
jgi:hypothetical protein